MKTKLALIFTIFNCSVLFAAQTSMEEIRSLYTKSAISEEACNSLIKLCTETSTLDKTILSGYKGCACMMMAKYYFNPLSKLHTFNAGKKILEDAIIADISNPELRYLRLTIQKNAPIFLGYANNIEQDKQFLENSLPSIKDVHLKTIITNYLKTI